jgi:hypothetical protein
MCRLGAIGVVDARGHGPEAVGRVVGVGVMGAGPTRRCVVPAGLGGGVRVVFGALGAVMTEDTWGGGPKVAGRGIEVGEGGAGVSDLTAGGDSPVDRGGVVSVSESALGVGDGVWMGAGGAGIDTKMREGGTPPGDLASPGAATAALGAGVRVSWCNLDASKVWDKGGSGPSTGGRVVGEERGRGYGEVAPPPGFTASTRANGSVVWVFLCSVVPVDVNLGGPRAVGRVPEVEGVGGDPTDNPRIQWALCLSDSFSHSF